MPGILRSARLAAVSLLLVTLAVAACSDDPPPPTVTPTPTPVPLTAEEILLLSESATSSVVAYRSTGEVTSDVVGEGARTFTMMASWSAPDRYHQVRHYESGTEGSPDFEMDRTELILIGDRMYTKEASRDEFSSYQGEWIETPAPSSDAPFGKFRFDRLTNPVLTGSATVNGVEAYRITITPEDPEQTSPGMMAPVEANSVVFISKSDFRPVRLESTSTYGAVEGEPDQAGATPAQPEFTMTSYTDYEYVSEPIAIEPPDEYVSLVGTGGIHTPTPMVYPTIVPAPVLPTFTKTGEGGPGALLRGEMVVVGSCLYVRDRFGTNWLPVFPFGHVSWDNNTLTVGEERFERGGAISLGGGEASDTLVMNMPYVQEPHEFCDMRNVWVVYVPGT